MSLRMKWWQVAGLLAYYAMFLNVGATIPMFAFLLGFVFGGFWGNPRNRTFRITDPEFLLESYMVMAFPLFIIVWSSWLLAAPSGASELQLTSKLLLSATVIILLYLNYFFCVKVLNTENVVRRLRWCIIFGPITSGGLTGIAGFFLALESFGIVSKNFWWVSLALLVGSLVSVIVFVIFLVLLGLEQLTAKPPSPQQAAG